MSVFPPEPVPTDPTADPTAPDARTGGARPRRVDARRAWTVAAAVALPLAVLGLLLWALWNPQERLDTVKAAVVNLDEPVEVDGQTVPLGRQLTAGLVSGGAASTDTGAVAVQPDPGTTNYDWVITDADDAAAGLADGTYAAVVTIPENFSAAATSFGGDPSAATQATLSVETTPGGRVVDEALARIVTTTATSVLGTTLTENYVDGVLTGFTTLHDQLGEAADGADQLADGAAQASDGATQLASGAGEVATGASALASGVGELGTGADGLAAGVGELGSGADQLASGAQGVASGAQGLAAGSRQVADGVGQSAAGAGQLASGAQSLAGGVGELSTGASDLASGLGALDASIADVRLPDGTSTGRSLPETATALATGSRDVAGGLAQVVAGLEQQKVAAGCAQDPASPTCQALDQQLAALRPLAAGAAGVAAGNEALAGSPSGQGGAPTGLYALAAGVDRLATGADDLAAGAAQASTGAAGVAQGAAALSTGLGQLAPGADQVADGAAQLSGGAGQLSTGADGLAAGVGALGSGADRLADGVGALGTGADQLATGTQELATGAGDLAGGVGQLAGGTSDLADGLGEATGQIPSYTDAERENLASVVADPVAAPGVDDLGTGSTGPLFAVLALWLGALAIFVAFPPVPARLLGSTRGPGRLALAALALPAGIAAATGLVVGGVLAAVEGASVGGWIGLLASGALASVVFVALNQALAALLGNVGRAIGLLVAVLLVATGIVATVPAALTSLRDVLPVGSALRLLTSIVDPGAAGGAGDAVALVLWGLVSVAVTTLVVARRRSVRVEQLLRA
ncbi:YhgE/Pip family protein [Cellulosimicrobium funkei]|uniref:YhgE/Pip domain-containing protein n=1 Tax=Cellulosimicrobium TaxID=157920 RepID=UPI00148EB34D|nr:YhgE/Pip domain-containing protein [Cellulosimicrobium sp. 72-3]